ncbi:MAG: hypothetical protein ACLFUB_05880 [Cyclobacteriaceae bacterium]
MKKEEERNQRLTAVFMIFAALLQFPLISVFNQKTDAGQWPTLFIYIMLVWLVLIVVLYLVLEKNTTSDH